MASKNWNRKGPNDQLSIPRQAYLNFHKGNFEIYERNELIKTIGEEPLYCVDAILECDLQPNERKALLNSICKSPLHCKHAFTYIKDLDIYEKHKLLEAILKHGDDKDLLDVIRLYIVLLNDDLNRILSNYIIQNQKLRVAYELYNTPHWKIPKDVKTMLEPLVIAYQLSNQ